jgi:hypothetical protein
MAWGLVSMLGLSVSGSSDLHLSASYVETQTCNRQVRKRGTQLVRGLYTAYKEKLGLELVPYSGCRLHRRA